MSKSFGDRAFLHSLWITILYTVLAVTANVLIALGLALMLNSPLMKRGNLWFRLAIFLPVITPDVAGYIVWKWMYNQDFGVVNAALEGLGLPAFGGIASVNTVLIAILAAEAWHHVGFYMLIFLTNMTLLDPNLTDAARVDGTTAWQRFRYVIMPQLRPAITINTVYALIQFLKTFTVVVVMTRGGPNFETNFVSYYAYQLFDQARYGEATAMATTLFALVIALAYGLYWLNERSDYR